MIRTLPLLALTLAAAAPALAAPAAPAAAPSAPPKEVQGLLVQPLPLKKCKERDRTCIAEVVAELKARFPEQVKTYCFQQKMQELSNHLMTGAIMNASGKNPAAEDQAFAQGVSIRLLCTTAPVETK